MRPGFVVATLVMALLGASLVGAQEESRENRLRERMQRRGDRLRERLQRQSDNLARNLERMGENLARSGRDMERAAENMERSLGGDIEPPDFRPLGEEPPAPAPSGGGWGKWILLLLLAVGAGAWWWKRRRAPPPAVEEAPAAEEPPAAAELPVDREAPTVGVPDARTRVTTPDARTDDSTQLSGAPEVSAEPGPKAGGELPGWLQAVLHGSLGDRYTDAAVLGSGGMGTVVKATDGRLLRTVAIKVPPPHLAGHEQFRARFLREAQALARLNHDHIASVYDIPEVGEGEIPVMILEFIEGTDLSEVLERQGPPPLKQGLIWILQAASGLQHAHENQILHRDIKPANLMVTSKDRKVKILDFGLAAIGDQAGLTKTGMLMGSVPFMPPEQFRGEKVSTAADQYALAATAYRVFTGVYPFEPDDPERTTVPRASTRRAGFPVELDDVLLRALAPVAAERYGSVGEFGAALRDAARAAAARSQAAG